MTTPMPFKELQRIIMAKPIPSIEETVALDPTAVPITFTMRFGPAPPASDIPAISDTLLLAARLTAAGARCKQEEG